MSRESEIGRAVGLSGYSFGSLLTVLFIGLKLTGVIDWSWWLILLPLWGIFALLSILWLLLFAFLVLARHFEGPEAAAKRKERRRKHLESLAEIDAHLDAMSEDLERMKRQRKEREHGS